MSGRMKDLTDMTIVSVSGQKYRLSRQAGWGAQGVVYGESTGKYMVKFYYPSGCQSIDDDIIERLRFIKAIKTPKNFVAVVDLIKSPYPGYIMDKVIGHKSLNSYLIPDKNLSFPEWYRKLGLFGRMFVGYVIAKAFSELEKSNLSYCDISGNNILIKIDNKSASVRMIDVDNIYIAGKGKSVVLGTPRYIAPEVISRQRNPDVLSDNYSLAVILFELLRVGHPYISDDVLDGTPEDEEAALAGKTDYVTDENSTNMLPEDIVFTDKLKELFRRCFVDGKKNRMSRPSATEFEYALLEASNKLIKCPSCGAWHYPRKNGKVYEGCPWCDGPSRPKAMLNFYDVLYEGNDYRNTRVLGTNKSGKLVNSYILKESWKNLIKSLYILRFDDLGKEKRSSENYMSVAQNEKGYHAYNEFSKAGIVIRKYASREFIRLDNRKPVSLQSGDEIYFEIDNNRAVSIECGGKHYSFIRMARFMEV
ncbi:MAG: protein kinase [Anaerolineaceae bacterium]